MYAFSNKGKEFKATVNEIKVFYGSSHWWELLNILDFFCTGREVSLWISYIL
jgi:hypothetical protein